MPKKILPKVKSPKTLKRLPLKELEDLSVEIRSLITRTVSKNGGHLASNLGVVDLTLAIHYVYDAPKDKIIWDVGHQGYTHKIVTGRAHKIKTIRQLNGLSGYLRTDESKYDCFGAGHVGTAVSAALGFAEARDLKNQKHNVVAVFGDGSLTNGLTYEGINNIGSNDTDITLVLNDNKYSISKNVGAIAKYLERLSAIKLKGEKETDFESIFHALGFTYFGPIDGHNLQELIDVFKLSKQMPGPKLIHVITKKGNGYSHSEKYPDTYHFTNPFMIESGKTAKDTKNLTYSKVVGNTLVKLARKDKRIVAITAAMPAGTGIDKFAKVFPDRFYDTGIAEEHAVTFAAGMAKAGMIPVFAVYSTFLQRAYDEILHDVALQKIPVIFCIDRAGIVGSDGPTHHGLFDLSYLRHIPNLALMAPKDENELQNMIAYAVKYKKGPIAIRYPRGSGYGITMDKKLNGSGMERAEKLSEGEDLCIIAVGSMVYSAQKAAETLKNLSINATVYNARSIKPIDKKMIAHASNVGKIITIEENVLEGGFGSLVLEELEKLNDNKAIVKRIGINKFVEHGEAGELRSIYGLTADNIVSAAEKMFKGTK